MLWMQKAWKHEIWMYKTKPRRKWKTQEEDAHQEEEPHNHLGGSGYVWFKIWLGSQHRTHGRRRRW